MKRTLLIAAVAALSAALSAQNVTPLNLNTAEFDLDSIREQAGNDEQYVIDLEAISRQVKADKDIINLAVKTAKSERNYYKAQVKLNKQRKKELASQEKMYKSQEKADKKEHKLIEKERNALLKDAALDQQSLTETNAGLEEREARLRDKERDRDYHLKEIKRDRELLKDDMIALSSYELDLKDKEAKIKHLQQTNKLQGQMLKNEIKSTKSKIKDQQKMAKLQQGK